MESDHKQPGVQKRMASVLLGVIIFSSFLPPFVHPVKAGLPVIDIPQRIKVVIDGVAMVVAQKMVDTMVKSTITWAGSGFEGQPAFVQDPEKYFGQIADSIAGSYIESSQLAGLCTPFQANIRISLAQNYVNETSEAYNPQCTLTGVANNLENFYESFESGGWESWIQMTQSDANNPIGAYLDASSELEKLIAEKTEQEQLKLQWGDGFRGKGDCIAYNPKDPKVLDSMTGDILIDKVFVDKTKAAGDCIKFGPDKTPGTVIKSQLDNVLPSGLEKLISVQHVEQLFAAFANGVLQKYVFGSQGLVGSRPASTPPSTTPGGTTTYTPPSAGEQSGCYASITEANVDTTTVTWSWGGEYNPQHKYSWNFDPQANVVDGDMTFVVVTYASPGIKRASLTIDRNISLFPAQTIPCSNSVEVRAPQQ